MSTRNSLAALEGASALLVAGATTAADASTYNIAGPKAFQGDAVVTKTGTGTYTIVVKPFKGPQGIAVPFVAAWVGIAEITSSTYSNDTLTVGVSTFSAMDATAADEKFSFMILAL